MKTLVLFFALLGSGTASAAEGFVADCYVDCYNTINFYVRNSSDAQYCTHEIGGRIVPAGRGRQACATRETVLVLKSVVGYGRCGSPSSLNRWKSQCQLAIRNWAPGRCLDVVGVVRGPGRCQSN